MEDDKKSTMVRRDVLANASVIASMMALFSNAGDKGFSAMASDVTTGTAGVDYARLRASLDGKPAYWLSRGVKYALSDFEITPIHGFSMLEGIVCEPTPAGGHLFRIFEAPYASDLETGEVIEMYTNPLTGAQVPIPHVQPLSLFYAVDQEGNLYIPPSDPRIGKVEFNGFIQARKSFSTDILSEERFVTRSPSSEGSSEKPTLTELINYTGVASSLSENGDGYAEARKSIVVFRNGLDGPDLGGYPPILLALYEGLKFFSFDDAVQETGETQMERTHPGFLQQLSQFI